MEIFRGKSAAQQAVRHGAVRIANGFCLSEKPTPNQLARIMSEQWPDCALDGYSAALKHVEKPLRFPLEFLRSSSLPSSKYFTSRRARPKGALTWDGVTVCNPLQAVEAMPEDDAVAFLEDFYSGKDGVSRLELSKLDYQRFPRPVKRALDRAIIGTDSVPERQLTRALAPHFAVQNNIKIGPYHWDLMIKEHKIAIEVDGYAYHRGENRRQFELDRHKLNDAVHRGWKPLHFTATTIDHYPDFVVQQVMATAKNKRPFARPPWQWHRLWRHESARR
ncbi:DUF559 domain-containing protein [Corynebacterium accolens]|uniref:DUF559 domain-containing protein n=1 Tax=Corynebacterium accolens TaxID=38284 RepID=UPI001EDC5379|nr:DUF559 domain-containing protein [Corynebacterium accolens]